MVNFFPGGVNLANAASIDYKYSVDYILYSFSPFPSFIDGFSGAEPLRLGPFTPVGGFSEFYLFGYFPLGCLFIVLAYFFYYIDSIINKLSNNYYIYGLLVFSSLLIIRLWSYNARSSMRLILFLIIVTVILNFLYKHKLLKLKNYAK